MNTVASEEPTQIGRPGRAVGVNAANTARSAHDRRGLRTWRRNTATSCRSTRISAFFDSAFFDRELRASRPSQASSCRRSNKAVVPPRTTIMPDDHRPVMVQVTAVDDPFGTHRHRVILLMGDAPSGRWACYGAKHY
jgi:hypothetical protein